MRVWWLMVLSGCGFQLALPGSTPPGEDAAVVDGDVVDGEVVDGTDVVDAMVDAPVSVDAMANTCPATGYTVTIAATSSKYRFKKTGGTPAAQAADCANDGVGTHIVSLDSQPEIVQLHAAAKTSGGWAMIPEHPNDAYVFVGGVQRLQQAQASGGWINVAGTTQVVSWGGDEPNDLDLTTQEDDEEQFLVLWLDDTHMADMVGRFNFGVICECDGLTPSTAFTTAFQAAIDDQ